MRALLLAASALAVLFASPTASAQAEPLHDREISWRSYDLGHERAARVRVFASGDERRPHTVVIDDRAENGRVPVTDEAPYVAETVAREIGFDPTEATFVFRFTEGSFVEGGSDRGKALLIKATFRRNASGSLGGAQWRVITSEALEDLTDRAMR